MAVKKKTKHSKPGRPHGSVQKRKFVETPLGRYIFLNEPILFNIICPDDKPCYYRHKITIELIDRIISASTNPSFNTKRYATYREEFIKNGFHVPRVKKITESNKEYYLNIKHRRARNIVKKKLKKRKPRRKTVNR